VSAQEYLERAVAAAEVGDDRAARRWARRALAEAPDGDVRGRILVHQAYHVASTSTVAAGLAILDEVDRMTGLSPAVTGRAQTNRGLLLLRSGSREALRAFDRALELLPADDDDGRCTVHLNRGVVHMERRALGEARQDFEAARVLAERLGSPATTAMAVANLAYVLMLAGDLPAALRALDAVAPVLAGLSPVLAAKCLTNRAEVLLAAGLLDEAAGDLEEAVRTLEREGNGFEQAEAEQLLATVRLAIGDATGARRLATRAARRFEVHELTARAVRSRVLALQARLAAGDRPAAVGAEALGLATWFAEQGLQHEQRRARLLAAEAYLAAGRPEDAREASADALQLRRRDLVLDRVRVRRVRAGLADAEGHGGAADRELRTALADLDRQVGLLGSLELRTAVGVHAQELALAAVDRAMARGRARQVLAWAETTRALAARHPAVTPPRDPDSARWLEELRQVRDEEAQASGTEADLLRERAVELERLLRRRAWQTSGPRERPGRLPVARLAGALADAGGVLYAVLGYRDTLVGLVLGDGEARMTVLGPMPDAVASARAVRADLDLLAASGTPPAIAEVARRSLAAGLARLSDTLLGPLGTDDRPLVLSPTAALSLVPWGMLPRLRGRTVTVSPTGSSWLLGRGSPPGAGAAARVGVVLGPGLRHGGREVAEVARVWPHADVRVAAGAADTLEVAGRSEVFHVAAHGVHRPQSPLFSHLLMQDGPLFGHELSALASPPRHVVLSACELGCAETRPGDERLGMTAALLAAGVGSVVAGVARVDDRVSAQVAVAHHRGLAAGLPPARALAEAVAALPEDAPPAPFVCFGSGW
jgi:tetratricopeptide (TPR) repeat protein